MEKLLLANLLTSVFNYYHFMIGPQVKCHCSCGCLRVYSEGKYLFSLDWP